MSELPNISADTLTGLHLHFVGIGGCGMSGLAQLSRQHGAICTGSDYVASDTTRALQADGIEVTLEQTADTVPQQCEVLVISAAIKPDHAEVLEAKRRGIPVIKYAQLLGKLMIGRNGIAVAGTHGKSTTTSVLSHLLIEAELDPSFIVGANCAQIGGGWRVGQSDVLVAEACEYDRSFHNFNPTNGIILNVEEDHLDLYANLDAVVESFVTFAKQLPADGSLLIQHESPHRLAVTGALDCQVETIGFAPQADWHVEIIESDNEKPIVRLSRSGEPVLEYVAPMPGEHMAYNTAAAAVTAYRLGADWGCLADALPRFAGLDRRMQRMGEHDSVMVVDDYGHHPTEVDTTLRALRTYYQPNRLICVFQPHQHSRTRFLMEQFAVSFSEADIVIIPDIYFVRDSEKERHAVRAADLVDRLRKQGKQAMHLYPFAAIVEVLSMLTEPGDLLVTMGAGDVWKVARQFLETSDE